MKGIVDNIRTQHSAVARASVRVGAEATIEAIENKKVPGGDVFEVARTAGILAAKRAGEVLPYCHQMPIENIKIDFSIDFFAVVVTAKVQAINKAGVEMEAMYAASVAALTICDMLRSIDRQVTIEKIARVEKKGEANDFLQKNLTGITAVVIVCSDSISAGTKSDRAGVAIMEKLKGNNIAVIDYVIIPDEPVMIREKVLDYCARNVDIVILTGGTGLSPRDVTPETLNLIIERRIPGIEEAIRAYGQERTPYSMLSRSIAGMIGNSLVLGLPGSTRGASESVDAIFPGVLHVFQVRKGARHN